MGVGSNPTPDTFFSISILLPLFKSGDSFFFYLYFRPVYAEEIVQEEVINDDTAELSLSKMEEEAEVIFSEMYFIHMSDKSAFSGQCSR